MTMTLYLPEFQIFSTISSDLAYLIDTISYGTNYLSLLVDNFFYVLYGVIANPLTLVKNINVKDVKSALMPFYYGLSIFNWFLYFECICAWFITIPWWSNFFLYISHHLGYNFLRSTRGICPTVMEIDFSPTLILFGWEFVLRQLELWLRVN